ncbi:hypothetical protein B0H10DRAFT_2221215 [Mycena sp. CBHHK59/15]|nr:hypothetical protein B0H10DRAFT_2221215 [Mycena sp. CBHHK59/15]
MDVNPYGEWNESMLADEDLVNDIRLHLQFLGKEITAEKLVKYLNDPEVCAEHGIDKPVSLTTALRYLDELGYRFTSPKKGQYVDGHERPDVVYYRDNVYLPRLFELNKRVAIFDNDGNPVNNDFTATGRRVIVWYHDESIFYAHDRRHQTWYHKDSPAKPYRKGEGHSFMVADYFSADFGWLRDPNNPKRNARRCMRPGKARDGYFTSVEVLEQASAARALVKELYPEFDHVFVYDNATTHKKRTEGSLSARSMPKGPSGTGLGAISDILSTNYTTVLAVIITSDRTTREGGADAMLDMLERRGWISAGDKTRVLTPTPAVGSSTNVAIHPFTNVIADCSPELMKRTTPAKIKEAFMARILNHAEAVGLIERSHDFIPGDYNTEFILKVALHFTVINTCAVHPTQNSAPQTVFRIYMPPLTKDLDKNRALMEHIASRDFSFNVPGRGLAQPWLGNPNTPNARPMDCPILNSAGYRSTHDIVDVDMNAQSEVATTLSLVTTDPSNAAPTSSDTGEAMTDDDIHRADQTLLEQLREHHHKLFARYRDTRTRRDRTQILVDAFAAQLGRMADSYVDWGAATAEDGLGATYTQPEGAVVEETRNVLVVCFLAAYYQDVPIIRGDHLVASAFVRQGLMPVAPHVPTVVITVHALEVYRVAHLRCPRLGIQPFIRTLCDIQRVAPRPWLAAQFSVAFDVYLAIRAVVDRRVQVALGRDAPDWRLKNACPACLYKLEGEPTLELPFLSTIDGNNSLKRFELREQEDVREDGTAVPGASKERLDRRVAPGDYYLSREEVDNWAREGLDDLMKGAIPDAEHDEDNDGCTERWQNMKEDVTARAWGMYDETGLFPALCRHGFVLIVVDMIKSGELGKYGYAITAHLLRVLGRLGLGYDIGCKFGKMVKAHPLLSKLARDNHFRSLVGIFHGHAHNRRCQLTHLATYVMGMGLEDLEGCESFFSKSNALAATTRYATAFHRQQAITTYLKHTDVFDTYQGLSLVICNKYHHALKIRQTMPALRDTMSRLGVASRRVFEEWLEKEKAHLRTLSKEPLQETMEMEYYQKLVNLQDVEERVSVALGVALPFVPVEGDAAYAAAVKSTRHIETQRRHALEVHTKALAAVHDLELRLGTKRWRALDRLEGLIIARMFELGKVNMSGTGYKLRKHIAKALQARSKAVKAAIIKYNDAAEAMTPQKPSLNWEQVVEFAFLSDFDLLREGREDIRKEPWALPSGRVAMDQHFKLLRADEEIQRLNLEIPRFVTHMVDEDAFLIREELRLSEEGRQGIAHQGGLLRMERGRFTALHMSRLVKLSKEPGFTACIVPGVSLCRERHVTVAREEGDMEMLDVSPAARDTFRETRLTPPSTLRPLPPQEPEWSDNGDDEDAYTGDEDDFGLSAAFMNIVRITRDVDDVDEDTENI